MLRICYFGCKMGLYIRGSIFYAPFGAARRRRRRNNLVSRKLLVTLGIHIRLYPFESFTSTTKLLVTSPGGDLFGPVEYSIWIYSRCIHLHNALFQADVGGAHLVGFHLGHPTLPTH
jgi:hypothetical protein